MANFSSRKDKKYNVDEIANQLIEQIKNNNVDSSKINIQNTVNTSTKNNNNSLWDAVKETADGLAKSNDNMWQGLKNGVLSFRQQLGRVTQDNPINRSINMQNNFLQEQLNKNSNNEKAKVLLNKNNSFQNKSNKESEEYLNSLQEKINKNNQKIIDNTNSIDNPILKKVSELTPSIGQMLPGMIGGPTGAIYFTGSASGNYYNDAMQRGMTKEQATMYSGTMGIIEGTLESIGAGLTKNVGKQLLKKNIKGALLNYGLDIGENFLEESIVEPLSELSAQIYAGKDKANWGNIGQRMIKSGVDGALVSAITGGVSGTIGAVGSKISKQNRINQNNTPNLQPQLTQTQQTLPAQQINQQESQMAQNGNIKPMLPVQRYVYEKSDNVKVDNLRQDASKHWDNSEKTRNYMNMLEKIIQDKDIDIRLDANLKDSQGRIANGSYSNGVITINPNSTRAGEFIAVHELTHAIGTDQMRKIVENYRKSNTEFNSAVQQLLKNYNSTELTEEAMADVAGQLFGNQEFINNLAQTEPSLFQKIYNEIKYLWHQFTGYKNQDQFISDLQYKWEQAYRSNARLNETTNYLISGEKSKIADRNKLEEAKLMKDKNATNEEIFKKTGWYFGGENKWKFEINDRTFKIKDNLKKNGKYWLEDVFEAKELYDAYPDLKYVPVDFIELDENTSGGYNFQDDAIVLNNSIFNKDSIAQKKDILHEIQHAIQYREEFAEGADSTTWAKRKEELKYSINSIDKDIKLIHEVIGLEQHRRELLDKMSKDENIEYWKEIEKFENNSKYAENLKKLKNKKEKYVQEYLKIKNRDNFELYQNTAGEQEAFNIEERSTYTDKQRKNTIPLVKNDKTVYIRSNNSMKEGASNVDSETKRYKTHIMEDTRNADTRNDRLPSRDSNTQEGNRISRDSKQESTKEQRRTSKNIKSNNVENSEKGSFNLPKIKEGYTRLYRGLENEYDANYDKSKLDNSNGYESWTDSYELAKAYGDNVYYIDVPSSEVKNSIIDEDSQSETYGDRNLLYKNDKSVGIKGKSGNEYMLYTDHDNYGNIRYNKVDDIATDNQGRTLSKEQQEYFKDSKVRDENGNLITVYHGTAETFTKFEKEMIGSNYNQDIQGFFFTDDIKQAENYANTTSYGTPRRNQGNVMETYLNITNPLVENIDFDPISHWDENYERLIKKANKNGNDGVIIKAQKYESMYVAFEPNQIKNIDNTNPTSNPDIRYSLPTKEWQQYLDENYKPSGTRTNLEDIKLPNKQEKNIPVNEEKRVAQILEKPVQKVKEKDRTWAIIKANLIDKGMVFEELSRKAGNRDLQGKWDYTLTSTARGQNAIGNARYELDSDTKTQKQISKSLTEIIDEVGENTADFYSYMYHQLNIDRMTLEDRFGGDTGINYERKNEVKNKPVFGESVTAQMSREEVQRLEKKHPEFKEYAQDVYDYLDANTKELVDNGVISKETQQLFKDMYPHYVPISRIDTKSISVSVPLDTGRTGINSPIKKATGGSSNINPLFETMADRTLQTYRASARNNFGVELKNTLNKTSQLNQITQQSDIDTIMEQMTDERQNNQLLQEGKNGENPTFTVFENGNKVTYEISKDIYEALKPKNELLAKIDDSKFSKIANKINNFRRGLLTEYNPIFSITNAIKDSQDILLNSQHSAKTYSKIPEATAQILSKGYWYNEYIQNGGAQNSYFKDGEFEVTKNNLPTKIKNTITFPLRAISNVNNVIEMTPRLAEYIVSREQGRSIETSMLDASRVTTNFKAGGDITKTLNRNGFTFLNASVQGMQQQIRNIQEANAKGLKGYAVLACKYAIAGVPVLLLNNLIWADDEEYDELQDYVKDNYYIIGKLSNGKFLRIPKGRAVATIQKIVSNANEFVKNDTINSDEVGKIFWEDMKENIKFGIDNLAPNNPMENNILSPVIQAITNKTWYGEDLVPTRLQNKPKEEQYDESTDKFSRWLGEKTGMSPIKINYLLDQYSGGVGDILLPLGTPQAENNAIEDKFTTDSTMKSKYPGEFFSKVDELEINSNSSKATDEDILKYKYISSVSSDIGKLYAEKRDIQNSDATDEKKKSQLKEVQKQINKLAKNSLENIDKVTKGDKYAQIDKNQYYKDVEGEWQKVTDKDKEKNKKSELSLKTYSSYKYQMSKVKQQKVNKGEMTKDQSLKNDDKIQILLDSNYSDKEKSAIYENYIKTQTKKGEYDSFDVIKASSIDIDEYLKFEQQDFTSDKKDDGTLDGKTVSKSKQKKVVQYLNSMKIDGNQRLLLYAMQGYTTNSSQKSQLAQYVYNLKLNKDTKLELYNKFSGFKVYKDGRVQW